LQFKAWAPGKARSRVKAIKAREGLAVRQSKARGAKASWNVKAWQGIVARQGKTSWYGKTSRQGKTSLLGNARPVPREDKSTPPGKLRKTLLERQSKVMKGLVGRRRKASLQGKEIQEKASWQGKASPRGKVIQGLVALQVFVARQGLETRHGGKIRHGGKARLVARQGFAEGKASRKGEAS
jgi:hypothetical protein